MSKKNTYIKELNSNINIQILEHLYRNCVIVGTKIVSRNNTLIIIELNDCTRIWMSQKELNINKIVGKNYNNTRIH